jgi:hypothetical protein
MSKHESDFYGWTQDTVELLQHRRFAEIDLDALMEEVSDMGGSILRELDSRLSVLIAHLLKWRYQPTHRGKSWLFTLKEQRHQLARLIKKNPSIKPKLQEALEEMYPSGVRAAALAMNCEEEDFPIQCPWTLEQVLDDDFYPGA